MAGDCNVCLYSCGDSADEFTKRDETSDTPAKCSECERVIPAGVKYQFAEMVCDGREEDYVTCLVCAEIRAAFYCDIEMYGGTFWDEMEDNAFEDMTIGCLDRLKTPEAKAYLLERWQKAKGLR